MQTVSTNKIRILGKGTINHMQYMDEYIKLEKGQEWSSKQEEKWVRDESVAKLKQKAV